MSSIDLTNGSVVGKLVKVIIPMTITNLINMLYNLTDMFWIGKNGTSSVAAIGTSGMFMWASIGFIMLAKLGTEVRVSQSFGKKDLDGVNAFALNGLKFGIIIAIVYGIVICIFRSQFVDIFNIKNVETSNYAKEYLFYGSFATMFMCINQVYISIFNGLGNSMKVMINIGVGLITNMLLDPLFIIKLNMGVKGAAIATLVATMIPTILFTISLIKSTNILKNFNFKLDIKIIKDLAKLGVVPMVHNVSFTLISMIISYYIVRYGDAAMGAQKIGVQIESLTWMVSGGVAAGLGVYIGQNFGAKKWNRMAKGFKLTLLIMSLYAVFTTLLFNFGGEMIFGIFSTDQNVIDIGSTYIKIASYAQLGMVFEGIGSGLLNGVSKTNIPAFFSLSGNLLRLPLIFILTPILGINGIWWALTISCLYKGIGIITMVITYFIRNKNINLVYFLQ